MSELGIIDNRKIKFKEKFIQFCKHTNNLKIASGYFYVSGFDLVKDDLSEIKSIKIVMGNETDPETAQELALGHKEKVEKELISDLNSISDEDKTKIKALEKLHEFITSTRDHLQQAYDRFLSLKEEYRRFKTDILREEIRNARQEVRAAMSQWRAIINESSLASMCS